MQKAESTWSLQGAPVIVEYQPLGQPQHHNCEHIHHEQVGTKMSLSQATRVKLCAAQHLRYAMMPEMNVGW